MLVFLHCLVLLFSSESPQQKPLQPRQKRDSLQAWFIRAEELMKSNLQQSEKYASDAHDLAIELNDEKEQARVSFLLGKIYFFQNKDELSLQAFNHAADLYLQLGDSTNGALSINGAGNVYMQKQKNFTEALRRYKMASEMLKNDTVTSIRIYTNMGTIYNRTNRFEEALAIYERVYDVAKSQNDLKNMSASLNNIGSVYDHMHNYEASVSYYLKSIEIKEAYQDYSGITNTLTNLAIAYSELGESDLCEKALNRALELARQYGFADSEIYAKIIMSELYADTKRPLLALAIIKSAWSQARATGIFFHNGSIFRKLSQMHQLNGNKDSALWYQQKYASFNDSLARQERKSVTNLVTSNTEGDEKSKNKSVWANNSKLFYLGMVVLIGIVTAGIFVAVSRLSKKQG